MNIWDYLILAALLLIIIAAARGLKKNRKNGKCSCGNCSFCEECNFKNTCGKAENK
jgi:hypothetical protein